MGKKPTIVPRKAPRVGELDERARFVAGTSTSERLDIQTSGRSGARVLVRKDGRELKRLTLYLPATLARALAHHSVEQDRDMSEVVAEAVSRLIESSMEDRS